jgi:glycerate kinase
VLTKKDLYYCGGFWGTMMIQSVIMQGVTKFATGVGGIQDFSGGSGVLLTVQWQVETLPQQPY